MSEYILSIDYGTQSVRAFLFDATGQTIARSRLAVEPYYSDKPGWAEQSPDYFWESLCKVCQQLWQVSPVPKAAIKGVAVATQRGTVLNLDATGNPLRPAMVWLDGRRADNFPPLHPVWRTLFKVAGVQSDIERVQAECEANWLKQHQPEIWQKTAKLLLLSGYFTYKLTGEFADSTCAQVAYLPFNSKKQKWSSNLDWKWQVMAVKPETLPTLHAPGTVLGQVSATAAAATGIPAGLPVIAAGADKACEVLGTGCLDAHQACLSYGTHATINVMSGKYLEVLPPLPPYPAAIPGKYNLELGVYRGYWLVSWFKKEFAHREQMLAQERGIEPEELFDELVREIPAGSMGLMLQPYWMPAFKSQLPEAKGSIIGFGDVHTRAHIYRAILEGIGYALREAKEKIEERTHVPLTELRISGGGAKSEVAMQLTADIFNLPALRLQTGEASSLGAAMAAAVGLGWYSDFKAAANSMTKIEKVFTPQKEAQALYDQLFQRVYKQMYERLHPLYVEIQKITGYPQL